MRLFVGIPVENRLKGKIEEIQKKLEEAKSDLKLVNLDNLHFTVKFLGDVPEDKIEMVKNALENTVEQFSPFEVSIEGIGFFPNEDYIRTIWLGVNKGNEEFLKLVKTVNSSLGQIKKDFRKPEVHLTIARMKNAKNKEKLKEVCEGMEAKVGEMQINKLILYSSELTKKGPVYNKLGEFKLK